MHPLPIVHASALGTLLLALLLIGWLVWHLLVAPYRLYVLFDRLASKHPGKVAVLKPFVPLIGYLAREKDYIAIDRPYGIVEDCLSLGSKMTLTFFGFVPQLIITDAGITQELLSTKMFDKLGLTFLNRFTIGQVIPESLIAIDGPRWKARRKLLNPVFHSAIISSYFPAMRRNTITFIDNVIAEPMAKQNGTLEIDIAAAFKTLTLGIIGSTAFGRTVFDDGHGEIKDNSQHAFLATSELLRYTMNFAKSIVNIIPGMARFPTSARKELDRHIKLCQDLAAKIVKERVKSLANQQDDDVARDTDLLDVLLATEDTTGTRLTANEIVDECMLFVLAGHETTSTLLSWTVYALSQNLEVVNRCREEFLSVVNEFRSVPTESDIKNMPYLHATILESLRLFPPVPLIGRTGIKSCTLDGVDIPPNVALIVSIWAMQRSEKYWPNPLQFDPNRFLHADDSMRSGPQVRLPSGKHHFTFLPFGQGMRNCPGQAFALLEARLILACFLARFAFELVPGQKIIEQVTITSSPMNGVIVRLHERHS